MFILHNRKMESFLEEVNYDERISKKENIGIRFCRKKYKCVVIFMLLTISFLQAVVMLSSHFTSLIESDIYNVSKNILDKMSNTSMSLL